MLDKVCPPTYHTNKCDASQVFRAKCSLFSFTVILHLFQLISACEIFNCNFLFGLTRLRLGITAVDDKALNTAGVAVRNLERLTFWVVI